MIIYVQLWGCCLERQFEIVINNISSVAQFSSNKLSSPALNSLLNFPRPTYSRIWLPEFRRLTSDQVCQTSLLVPTARDRLVCVASLSNIPAKAFLVLVMADPAYNGIRDLVLRHFGTTSCNHRPQCHVVTILTCLYIWHK